MEVGFYSKDQIKYLRELEINTRYGKPSDSIKVYNLGNLEIAFFLDMAEYIV